MHKHRVHTPVAALGQLAHSVQHTAKQTACAYLLLQHTVHSTLHPAEMQTWVKMEQAM